MNQNKLFYISSPIYYANARPHLGHLHSTLYADVIARFQREQGKTVVFVTGCDQHGSKIAQVAKEKKQNPEIFIQEQTKLFLTLWKKAGISYTHFVQTHSLEHQTFVINTFKNLIENNHLYQSQYRGFYCLNCANFLSSRSSNSQSFDFCTNCQKNAVFLEENNFFLRVSNQQKEQLLSFINQQKKQNIAPHWFNQLDDLLSLPSLDFSLTRSRKNLSWGIDLGKEFTNQIAYVWFDALLSYWSCLSKNLEKQLWTNPDTEIVHVLGKEITKFHLVYWPLLCWNRNYRLPNHFLIHGWLLNQGQKMSKSVPISVIDPETIIQEYGVDVLRIYLVSLMHPQLDVRFDSKLLAEFYQVNIVNNLSNYYYRVLSMVKKYKLIFESNPSWKKQLHLEANQIQKTIEGYIQSYQESLIKFVPAKALEHIFSFLDYGNKFIEEKKPWNLFKSDHHYLNFVLYHCLLITKVSAILLRPIAPCLSKTILAQIDLSSETKLSLNLDWVSPFIVHKVVKLFE